MNLPKLDGQSRGFIKGQAPGTGQIDQLRRNLRATCYKRLQLKLTHVITI